MFRVAKQVLVQLLLLNGALKSSPALAQDLEDPQTYSGLFKDIPSGFKSEYERKLAHKTSIESDFFGSSVAMNDRRVIVGAPASTSDELYPNAGNVFVYALSDSASGAQWTEIYEISDPTPAIADYFGRAVAIGNERCVVASSNRANFFFRTGNYFEDGTEAWSFGNSVSGLHYMDNFGAAVAMDGDELAVVTATSSPNGPYAAVIKYVANAYGVKRWMMSMLVMPSDPLSGFGASVALHGKLLLVGAPSNVVTETGVKTGAVHVYQLAITYVYNSYDAATESAVLRASDMGDGFNFGQSVAVYDHDDFEYIAIGSNSVDLSFGKVYIFQRFYNASGFPEWTETQQLVPSSCVGCAFGSVIASSQDFLAVANSGSVYLYSTPTQDMALFRLIFAVTPLDGRDGGSFGSAVSLYGSNIAVGANKGDGYVEGSGAVYVYTEAPEDSGGWGGDSIFSSTSDSHVAVFAVAGTVGGFALIVVGLYWLVSPKAKAGPAKEAIDSSATGLMML